MSETRNTIHNEVDAMLDESERFAKAVSRYAHGAGTHTVAFIIGLLVLLEVAKTRFPKAFTQAAEILNASNKSKWRIENDETPT